MNNYGFLLRPHTNVLPLWQQIAKEQGEVLGETFFIREALPEDGLLLNIRDEQLDTFKNPSLDELTRYHAWYAQLTPINYSVFHGNKYFVNIVILPMIEGVAEILFLVDQNMAHCEKPVRKALMEMFNKGIRTLEFRKLTCKVRSDFLIGQAFVQNLGFSMEGVSRKLGSQGHDYIYYGRLKEEHG